MPFVHLFNTLITFYIWLLIIGVALSWLLMFNVINGRNPFVRGVYDFCAALTDPALRKVREVVKPINGIDISPILLILGLEFLRDCINWYLVPFLIETHY